MREKSDSGGEVSCPRSNSCSVAELGVESRLSGCCELCPQASMRNLQVRGKPQACLSDWTLGYRILNSHFKLSIYLRLWQKDVFILGRNTFSGLTSPDLRPKFSQIGPQPPASPQISPSELKPSSSPDLFRQ